MFRHMDAADYQHYFLSQSLHLLHAILVQTGVELMTFDSYSTLFLLNNTNIAYQKSVCRKLCTKFDNIRFMILYVGTTLFLSHF